MDDKFDICLVKLSIIQSEVYSETLFNTDSQRLYDFTSLVIIHDI